MKSWSLFLVSILLSACAHAQSTGIFRGDTHEAVDLTQTVASVKPGSIVVIGENHGLKLDQQQQVSVMQALRAQGLKVSVGLEFFTYTYQAQVDAFRAGTLAEPDFLKQIEWGSPSFDFYRDQAIFPNLSEGAMTLALNAPRTLTGQVAKGGIESLTADQAKLLPPQFSLGRSSYKERFMKVMASHLPSPEMGDHYFAAQSIWDDTMAWRATEFIAAHPDQVLVVVVGEFHVQFGGGLPDRIRARSPLTSVLTFSQIDTTGLSDADIADEMAVSPVEGPRANYLILAPAQGLAK